MFAFSVNMSDTNVVSQVGTSVEFSFNVILARFYIITFFISDGIFRTIASLSTSIQLEQAQSMKCSVRKSFEISASSNLQNEVKPILNRTFEFTSDDIRFVSNENRTSCHSWPI